MNPEITTSSNKPHFVALDGLRGIGAMIIMLGHYMDPFFAYDPVRNPFTHKFMVVDFFFCLSGFVIAYVYDERMKDISIKRFFINRLIRLHPLVVIGIVIGFFAYIIDPFHGTAFASNWKVLIFVFLMSLVMIPTPILEYRRNILFPYNGPAWSLFFQYIANIFYAIILCRLHRKWLLVLGALSAVFLAYMGHSSGWLTGGWGIHNYMIGFPRISFCFITGLLLVRYHVIFRHRFGFLLPCLLLIGMLLVPHRQNDWIVEVFMIVLVLPIVVSLGAGCKTSGMTEKICNLLGRISYPLFITHMPTVHLFESYYAKYKLTMGKPFLMVVAISLICFNLLFAYAIMRWVDEPLRKWLNSKYRKTDNVKQKGTNKKIAGIAMILTVVFFLFAYLLLPSNWKEKILFPINFPSVQTTAVTNNTDRFVFSEKIWLHRVNSIERANIMTEWHKGIEIDIIWDMDSAHFYVAHDPDPEIYLPLHQMFDSIKNIQNHYIWLDFKNLNEENTTLALDYLLKLKINRANVIVESGEPHLLSDFSAAGFATSYYLPIFNPYTASENEIIGYVKEIDTMLQKSNVNFISSDFVMYHFIKKYFPGSQILLWHLEKNRYTPYVRNILVRDENVKVILVHEYSEGYQ